MSELIEEIVADYRNKNKKLEQENNTLLTKLNEYENKFGCYTKEQTMLLCKIQQVKEILLNSEITKSGYNSHSQYEYFQLEDITPIIIKALLDKKLASKFYPRNDRLYLQIVDLESGAWDQVSTKLKPYNREYTPKGDITYLMKDEQAAQTYARRTLWLLMLDIVEPVPEEPEKTKNNTTTTSNTNETTFMLPDKMDEVTYEIFTKIRKDFGTRVPFNKRTITNKLDSMKKSGTIDEQMYTNCKALLK